MAPATGVAVGSTAAADSGYSFVNWTDSGSNEVSTSLHFTPAKVGGLNVAATYTANFEGKLIPITVSGDVDVAPGQDMIRFYVRDAQGNLVDDLDTAFDKWYVIISNPGSNNTITLVTYGGDVIGPYDFQIRVENIPSGTLLTQVQVWYYGYAVPLLVIDGINL